jgi:hypothetical protein
VRVKAKGPLADLHGRQHGFQRAAVLLAVGPGSPQLVDVLADRRGCLARTQNMLVHRPDVPGRAVGRRRPRCVIERAEQRERTVGLLGLTAHRLVMG